MDGQHCSSDDWGPVKKRQKRDSCAEYKKAVSILKQCDITRRNKHVYRPLDFIMANIKKEKSRFGTVVLSRDMTEGEVRSKIYETFPILNNNRFSFAAADITGALDFHEESSWTGAVVKRRVPGGSALYIVMKEVENNKNEPDTGKPKHVTVDSTEKLHSKFSNVSQPGIQRVTHVPHQGTTTSGTYNGVGQETLVCVHNSLPFRQDKTVPSIALSGSYSTASPTVSTRPCKVFTSSVKESVPGVISDEQSTRAEESIRLQQYKHARNSSMSTVCETVEHPLTASVVSGAGLTTSCGQRQSKQTLGEQPATVNDKQLYSMAHFPAWVLTSEDIHPMQQGATADSGTHRECAMLHPPVTQRQSQGPAGMNMFSSNMVVRNASSSYVSVPYNNVSIKKERETSACSYKDSTKKTESVETKFNKSMDISTNDGKFGVIYTMSNKAQQPKSTPDARITYDRPTVTGVSMNRSTSSASVEGVLSTNSFRTTAPSPWCTGSSTVIASLSHAQLQSGTSRFSSQEAVFSEDEACWNSVVNSSRKCIDEALNKMLGDLRDESHENQTDGSYGIIDEMIPSRGSLQGGQEFVVILKEPLPRFFKADEVMVRFGQDPGVVSVFWKGDKILKGETKAASESGSVKVTLETTGGAVLGHALFTYTDPLTDTLRRVACSQELAPLVMDLLEQNIQGFGCHSRLQDTRAHTKPSTDSVIGQSLLELMIYVAAKFGAHKFIHAAFSSPVSETAVRRYSGRAMRPEHVAGRMGHQQLAEYLDECYDRCIVQDKSISSEIRNNGAVYSSVSPFPTSMSLQTANQDQPSNMSLQTANQGQPSNTSLQTANQDQPSNMSLQTANQGQPSNTSLQTANQDQPSDTSLQTANQDQPSNMSLQTANQGQSSNTSLQTGNQDQPSDTSLQTANQDEPSNTSQQTANQGQPSNTSLQTGNQDQPSDTPLQTPNQAQPSNTLLQTGNQDTSLQTANQDQPSNELNSSVSTPLMLLSDVASKLNESGQAENRTLSQDIHLNEADDDSYMLDTENVEKRGRFFISESVSFSDNKEKNLTSPLGASGKDTFQCPTCGENSTTRSSVGNEVSNKTSVTNGDGVIVNQITHASKDTTQTRTTQSCYKTEYIQKVMLVHGNSPSPSSYALPRHLSPDHVGCSCCKKVLLNVGMSEREVKAEIASAFQIPDQEGFLLATANCYDKLCIGKVEEWSGVNIYQKTNGASVLYVLKVTAVATQMETARISVDAYTYVEYRKRVMVLNDGKLYLPSAMELASRRRHKELYQSVVFSKKMEQHEVMSQLRKAFGILGSDSFHLAVADKNGVLDFRNGKEWNGNNISRWAKNACVLYIVPEIKLKEDPIFCYVNVTPKSFEQGADSDCGSTEFADSTAERVETGNERDFPEITTEKCVAGQRESTSQNLTLLNKRTANEEDVIKERGGNGTIQIKVERLSTDEEQLIEDEVDNNNEKTRSAYESIRMELPRDFHITIPESRSISQLPLAERSRARLHGDFSFHLQPIGLGGLGQVYAGTDKKSGREVAVKMIDRKRQLSLFRADDVRELVSLEHNENLLPYIELLEDERHIYVIQELMTGTLDNFIECNGATLTDYGTLICLHVLRGLQCLHRNAIVHGNLKPNNILYSKTPELRFVVSDFGLAVLEAHPCNLNNRARLWMAPEVQRGEGYSQLSDVFSAGLVLHYAVSAKHHPFTPKNVGNRSLLETQRVTERNILLGQIHLDDNLPTGVRNLVARMLTNNSKERSTVVEALSHSSFLTR